MYEEILIFTDRCSKCGKEYQYDEHVQGVRYRQNDVVALRTVDCHGIPFRMVCVDCYNDIENGKGYDGEYYTELDECIDDDSYLSKIYEFVNNFYEEQDGEALKAGINKFLNN